LLVENRELHLSVLLSISAVCHALFLDRFRLRLLFNIERGKGDRIVKPNLVAANVKVPQADLMKIAETGHRSQKRILV